ncbi:MAG TPA: DMT family transporter [Sphaerochaeta sp.]|nr:DMT family transporter [Sphaerochaeta sp.]
MHLTLYLALSALSGMVIAVMVVANTLLGQATTMGVSLIINHIIGLVLLSAILLVGRKRPAIRGPGKPAPWYLYFNGLFGVAILNINYVTIISIGASLAMASAVFGQAASSLIFDLTGWMGIKKRTLNPTKVVSLAVCALGIVIMAQSGEGGSFKVGYILLSALAGVLTMTQMILNSTFAVYKGPIRAAQQNFIGGLGAGLLFYLLLQREETIEAIGKIPTISPLLLVTGGLLAVFVVVTTSYVVVKIPAVYSALLLSAFQVLMSLVIDTFFFDAFALPLLLGALLMLFGMGGNLYSDTTRA